MLDKIRLYTKPKVLKFNDTRYKLTDREFVILRKLIENPGKGYSAEKLLSFIALENTKSNRIILSTLIGRIRGMMRRGFIETIYGHGYSFIIYK